MAFGGAIIGGVIGGVSGYMASGDWKGAAAGAAIGAGAGFLGQFGGSWYGGAAVGAMVGGGSNFAWQMGVEGKNMECVDWGQVGASALLGGVTGGLGNGSEMKIGKNVRIAPGGNRTGNPLGELPHYHRRVVLPNGTTRAGQGIGRHRPWQSSKLDKNFWDRF